MSQIHKTASTIAKIQSTLDVYEGLFARKEDAEKILTHFQEIGEAIKRSLSTEIIIGCAALFSDPDKSCGNENMSFKNLISKYECKFSNETQKGKNQIFNLIAQMNLKKFRNKHVGHFGLDEMLGNNHIIRDITVMNVRELLNKAQIFLNMIIHDSGLMPQNESLNFYRKISESRSTAEFLKRLTCNA